MNHLIGSLKALGDETRMRIIQLLLNRDYCVRALARQLNLSEAAISQHIRVLKEAGFLIGERSGHFMHYRVQRDRIVLVGKELNRFIEGSLKAYPINDVSKKDSHNQNGCAGNNTCPKKTNQKGDPCQ